MADRKDDQSSKGKSANPASQSNQSPGSRGTPGSKGTDRGGMTGSSKGTPSDANRSDANRSDANRGGGSFGTKRNLSDEYIGDADDDDNEP